MAQTSEPVRIAELLGGEKALGQRVRTALELEECARKGFPTAVVKVLIERSVLDAKELYRWVVPRRTLAHRLQRRQRLSVDESNRISRLARIYALAVDVLGSDDKAKNWLRKPLRQFGTRSAIEMLETEFGAHEVENLLGRISHGIAA
ncbi:MAG: antitoxin Xre/MbcA/ParS toxin-binding domain-containing protein [Candidatus Binataceae bacterium]